VSESQSKFLLKGLVLSGGQSSRMGFDKGGVVRGSFSERERCERLLRKYCDETYISVRPVQIESLEKGLRPIVDWQNTQQGPIAGIVSAIKKFPTHSWLSLACDLMLSEQETIEYLLQRRQRKAAATCFANPIDGKPDPSLVLWESHANASLLAWYDAGERSLRRYLQTHMAEVLACPNQVWLQNINNQFDLANVEDNVLKLQV